MIQELIENLTLLILFLFLTTFVIFGIIYRNGYLATRPRQNPSNPNKKRDDDEVKEEFEEWEREKTFSSTLAGFSLTALVFVLAFQNLSSVQRMAEFFVLGFILEMLSFLCYKYMVKRGYEYFGTVFQFAGLLAMYNGFFVFVFKSMFTPVMFVGFIGGYIVFFVLAAKQLGTYVEVCSSWKN